MKTKIILIVFLFTAICLWAAESKKVEKSFTVEAGKRIELNGVSGMDVKVKSWDKNEVKFDLLIRVKSSDDEYEKAYIEEFDITEWETSSDFVIDINETDEESGWSIFDIFKLKFGNSISKEIKGSIFVPNDNPFETNISYSDILLEGMTSEINLIGRGNKIELVKCGNIRRVQNNYGEIIIRESKGELTLETRSTKLLINQFEGEIDVDAYYTDMNVTDISSNAKISSRSAKLVIANIGANLEVKADYSNIDIKNVAGNVEVTDRSGEVDITNIGGLLFEGPYTKLRVTKITGSSSNEVRISNRSGLVNLSDVKGNVFIDDQYSNMKLEKITGNVELTSRSSTIYADKIGGNWKSTTQYCSIEIMRIDGTEIYINNRSNPVTVNMNNTPELIDIENTYGDVKIVSASGFKGNVKLEAVYGEIKSDLALSYQSSGSTVKASGKIGAGNSKINIKTRSGNINLTTR